MKPKLNKQKVCKICKKKFAQKQPLQFVCDLDCAIDYKNQQSEKLKKKKQREANVEKRKKLDKLKTKGDHMKDLQITFNAFIRERDRHLPCISCDAPQGTYKLTAGHFYPTTYSYLRFHEDNVHSQCWFNCNKNRHGNIGEYRPRLIDKIGIDKVKWLDDNRHKRLELTIPEIIELRVIYKEKIRKLKK